MPRIFKLTGPAAHIEGDVEIDNLGDYAVLQVKKGADEITVTICDPTSPGEVDEVEDALHYLDRLGFSEIGE